MATIKRHFKLMFTLVVNEEGLDFFDQFGGPTTQELLEWFQETQGQGPPVSFQAAMLVETDENGVVKSVAKRDADVESESLEQKAERAYDAAYETFLR